MEGIEEKLGKLMVSVESIQEDNKRLYHRLKILEDKDQGSSEPRVHTGRAPRGSQLTHDSNELLGDISDNGGGDGAVGGAKQKVSLDGSECALIQQEFNVIKDALQKVKLPNDLKIDESKQGVSRSDQKRMFVIQKCGRYGETLLKLLSTVQHDTITPGDIQDMVTIVVAQMRYLQEEHAMLLVNNNFGEDVEKVYRQLRRNTTQFTPDALETLQAAINLSNHSAEGGRYNRGRSSYRGRGGRFNSRGRGYYSTYSRNSVPPYRNQESHTSGNVTDGQ